MPLTPLEWIIIAWLGSHTIAIVVGVWRAATWVSTVNATLVVLTKSLDDQDTKYVSLIGCSELRSSCIAARGFEGVSQEQSTLKTWLDNQTVRLDRLLEERLPKLEMDLKSEIQSLRALVITMGRSQP